MIDHKNKSREQVISDMCMTWRHDYGLDKDPEDIIGCGMTDSQRSFLRMQMGQLYDHHIAPFRVKEPTLWQKIKRKLSGK